MATKLTAVAVVVLLLNLPFGYWRAGVRKFSWQWFVAVHAPVPMIIGLRFLAGLGFHFVTYPALVGAYAAGQFLGGRWYTHRRDRVRRPR